MKARGPGAPPCVWSVMARRGTNSRTIAANRPAQNAREVYQAARRTAYSSAPDDIFAINPVRRSAAITAGSWALLILPAAFMRGDLQALLLIGFGWMAAAGIVFVTPIFFWSLAEVGWRAIVRRRRPGIDQLDISPRAYNLLVRHGYETIEHVDRTPDSSLILLSNMDARTLHYIRRAINIWKYQRWQERGFPLGETPDSII
ncbi:hypothetical protein BH23CHL2_BH23CHL2_08330 [soil metagenome]